MDRSGETLAKLKLSNAIGPYRSATDLVVNLPWESRMPAGGSPVSHPNSSPSPPTSSPLSRLLGLLLSPLVFTLCCALVHSVSPYGCLSSHSCAVEYSSSDAASCSPRPVARLVLYCQFSALAAIDQQSFSPQTTQVACLSHLCDFQFSQSISSKAINRLQASPTFLSWLTRKLPRYLTSTPRATFFH